MITGYEEWKRNVFEEGEKAMRRQNVLRMLSKGLSEGEVADLLGLSTEEVSSIASESENDSKA